MNELIEWLRAQLDEDERVAQAAHYEGQRWLSEEEDVCRWPDDEIVHVADRKRDATHIARHDPARVLAEVAAKRRIITWAERHPQTCSNVHPQYDVYHPDGHGPHELVRLLASVYTGRPGWREEWKP